MAVLLRVQVFRYVTLCYQGRALAVFKRIVLLPKCRELLAQ